MTHPEDDAQPVTVPAAVPGPETSEAPTAETSQVPAAETSQVPAAETSQVPAAETSQVPAAETSDVPAAETSVAPAAESSVAPVASPFASPSGRRELPATPTPEPVDTVARPVPVGPVPSTPVSSAPTHAPGSHWSVPHGSVPPAPWAGVPYSATGASAAEPGVHTVVLHRKRRRSLSAAWVVPLVVMALAAGAVGGVLGSRLAEDDHLADAGLPVAPVGAGTQERPPSSVAGIAAGVLPSVVSIQVDGPEGSATGSGFVLRGDGYLVTNNHVIAQADGAASSITVTFVDGSELDASIVGRTVDYDLAVLKVEIQGLTPLVLGDSDLVVVGDPVVAVGAPLGLAGTVTTGIVSALNRPVSADESEDSDGTAFINAIQTDAAINPGNSGGPLVNGSGEVIGINSAIAQPPGSLSSIGGSIGLGFAIPSNQVRRTADQLIETGVATYPIIGVLLDQRYTGEGVQVSTDEQENRPAVSAGGPAERAGIHPGDVILAIDGRPVTDPDELIVAIRARTPGDTIVLRVRTGASERDVRVKLDESPRD